MDGRAIRIQGDQIVVEEIAALLQASDDAEYLRTEQDDSGGVGANFALETVATVVAIVKDVFFLGQNVPKLYGLLHRHRGTRISIETPTRSETIEVTGELSDDALRKILNDLATA